MPGPYMRTPARESVLGHEQTQNPHPAAVYVLGGGRRAPPRRHYDTPAARGVRGPRATANPLPAAAAILGQIIKLPKFLKKPSEQRAAAVAPTLLQSALAGNLTAVKAMLERTQFGIAAERAVWQQAVAQLPPALLQAVERHRAQIPAVDHKGPETAAESAVMRAFMLPNVAAPAAPGGLPVGLAGQLAVPIVRELVKPARRTSSRRQRYPTYVDRQGRQRYSTKPPGTELRIPQGATPSAGSPYSFFRGAVGKGGAATTAGQLAVAAAAGAAAYLVTQRLLQHLGGRAQRKEEAGVNAALAFRQARADFQQQEGRPMNAAELREAKAAYQQQLIELGYDPVTFTRTRSGVERFLEDYNPFGG